MQSITNNRIENLKFRKTRILALIKQEEVQNHAIVKFYINDLIRLAAKQLKS